MPMRNGGVTAVLPWIFCPSLILSFICSSAGTENEPFLKPRQDPASTYLPPLGSGLQATKDGFRIPHPFSHKTIIPWSDLRTVLFKLWCAQGHPGDLAKMQILIPLGDSTGQFAFPRSSQVMLVLLVMGRSLGSRHCMTINQASPWSLLLPSLTCTSHQYHIPSWRSSTAC